MVKAHVDTRTYNQDEDTIKMDGWISATLHNVGDAEVFIMGVGVKSGESFVIGNATTALHSDIRLKWNSENKEECSCIVHYIQAIC